MARIPQSDSALKRRPTLLVPFDRLSQSVRQRSLG
jgi:hypothetical protein